jgi:hypothetical protein
MNGRDLTLGIAAGLAVAGVVAKRRRGSRELTSLTAPQGLSPAQPWKGLVGAAKGGPARQAYTEAFARFPLDLSIEIVGSQEQAEAWLQKVQRPGPGKLRACLWTWTEYRSNEYIQNMRKEYPSMAAALYSPFTVAHRLFDASRSPPSYNQKYTGLIDDPSHKLPLSAALWEEVSGGTETKEMAAEAIREWAFDECDKDGYDAMDACAEASFAQWASIRKVYRDADDLWRSKLYYGDVSEMKHLMDKGEYSVYFLPRVLVSLVCPTAAGRLLRLTSYGQAMADCYATWTVSGRNPLVRLTERDLTHFSVDAQIQRWLATASAKKATEGQIQKYRNELERIAVPVLRILRENDPDLLRQAARMGEELHERRAGLIEATNQMYALQRVVVL